MREEGEQREFKEASKAELKKSSVRDEGGGHHMWLQMLQLTVAHELKQLNRGCRGLSVEWSGGRNTSKKTRGYCVWVCWVWDCGAARALKV